jgi:hypothetical protein
MNEYDYLVFLTLAYSSCFSFALTEQEIIQRLPKAPNQLLLSENKIKRALKKLLHKGLIQNNRQYFYLDEKDLANRKKRAKFVIERQTRVNEFIILAKRIPFVCAIILTGSTAVNNAQRDDDLDFMIICKKNTLWISRFLLIILTKINNKRPNQNSKNAWCFNIFLDESSLTLDKNRRSLYEAYEILQMIFVFDRANYQEKFLNANQWLKNYLFFYDHFKSGQYTKTMSFSIINQLLFYLQKKYRLIVFGQENFSLSLGQAFFNQLDFKTKLFAKLRKKLTDFTIT